MKSKSTFDNLLEYAREHQKVSQRFLVIKVAGEPRYQVIDCETGKATIIPMYAYTAVVNALHGLFA